MSYKRNLLIILLLILMVSWAAVAQAQTAERIGYGELVNGELTTATPEMTYEFEAKSGDVIVVAMAAEFDTRLYINNDAGTELISDDDTGFGTDSLIANYTIPAAGTFTIRATSFSGSAEGSFGLYVDEVSALQSVEPGQVIEGESEGLIGVYRVAAQADDVLLVNVTAEGSDSGAALIDSSGYNVSESAYLDGLNGRLGPSVLQQDDNYIVVAAGTGAYTVSFSNVDLTTLTLGEGVTASLTPDSEGLYYSFVAEAGQVLNISADSGSTLDTRMVVLGPYGYEVANNDDAPGSIDPAISDYVVDSEGTYIVVITSQNPNARLAGDVVVTVTTAELTSLDDGPVTVELDTEQTAQVLTFNGVAGEVIRMTFDVSSADSFASPYLDITQKKNSIVYLSLRGVNRLQFDFVVTTDGPINVSVESYSAITFGITLERDPADPQ